MNLPMRLAEIARVSPGHEAIVFNNKRMTYAQLETRVSQMAVGLQQIGIKSGDKVLLAMGNCPEFVIAYYAIIRMKGIIVPISPQHTINEFGVVIKDCQPTAVITTTELKEKFKDLNEKMNISLKVIVNTHDPEGEGYLTVEQVLAQGNGAYPDTKYSREDVAVILYTAATAGKPKGAMLTNYNLYSNALTFTQSCKIGPADRALLTSPVYHAAAQTCVMNSSIVAGATLVIQKGWQGPAKTLELIENEKISFFFGPPTIYNFIINYSELEKYNTSSLRIALTGAATMQPDLYEDFQAKMKLPFTEGYGLTETSPVVTLNFIASSGKPGSIGKPIPGVEVKIFDYEDREVPQGQVGEIVVRGPNVMKGYYNRDEETRWAMRNGWFHTGDLAYFDQDGDLYIVDRKKELIIRGGININPREVEEVLYDHPDIYEVAVVGVPDAVMGEEVLAFVMPRQGKTLDGDEIKKFCEGRMADYKIPRYYKIVENIPRTTSGKLLRKELLNWISKQ